HHAARRCGRVAARGARAGRADAAHWRAHEPGLGRCGRATRRSYRACRSWVGPSAATCGSSIVGRRRCRTLSQTRVGIGGARAGRHPGWWRRGRTVAAAGDSHRANDCDGERVGARSSRAVTTLAARYRLPAVYASPIFANAGGLISYGLDSIDPYRLAAGYVDRILQGGKPADLPVPAAREEPL